MIHMEKFHFKRAKFYFVILFYDMNVKRRLILEILLALHDYSPGKLPGINRRVADFRNDMGNGADMVVMAVSNYYPPDFMDFVLKISNVRDQIIHSRHILFRKLQSRVNDNNVIAVFKNSHIAA